MPTRFRITRLPHKLASCLELLLFLGGVPLWVLYQENYILRRCLLLAAGLYVVARLWGKVSWRNLFLRPPAGWWQGPLMRAGLALTMLAGFVFVFEPENLFNLPREHFGLWFAFIIFYPALSVLPQELIYRVYIFEVHKGLLNPPVWALLVSAASFSWLHIIFAGWFALAATFVAGLFLAWNYQQNRYAPGAIWPLVLEHSLYGQLAFTLGLYQYFFIAR